MGKERAGGQGLAVRVGCRKPRRRRAPPIRRSMPEPASRPSAHRSGRSQKTYVVPCLTRGLASLPRAAQTEKRPNPGTPGPRRGRQVRGRGDAMAKILCIPPTPSHGQPWTAKPCIQPARQKATSTQPIPKAAVCRPAPIRGLAPSGTFTAASSAGFASAGSHQGHAAPPHKHHPSQRAICLGLIPAAARFVAGRPYPSAISRLLARRLISPASVLPTSARARPPTQAPEDMPASSARSARCRAQAISECGFSLHLGKARRDVDIVDCADPVRWCAPDRLPTARPAGNPPADRAGAIAPS